MSLRNSLKSFMLCAAVSSTMIAPMPVFADNVYVMALNTRSEDGIYRPSLRVIRNGTVTFYRSEDSTLTKEIFYNKSALSEWLATNAGLTAEESASAIFEVAPNGAPAAPTATASAEVAKPSACPAGFTLVALPGGGTACSIPRG